MAAISFHPHPSASHPLPIGRSRPKERMDKWISCGGCKITMKKKKERFIDIMRKEAKETKRITFIEIFELITVIGFAFFIMLIGVWAIPQMKPELQWFFAPTVVCASCYVMYHQLKEWGCFDKAVK